jgi:hypothetical protein
MTTQATSGHVLACFFFHDVCPAMAGDKARQAQAIDGLITLTRAMGITSDFVRDVQALQGALQSSADASRKGPPKDRDQEEEELRRQLIAQFEGPASADAPPIAAAMFSPLASMGADK